jgi:peptidoglycan hydrolase-like protein with peptidoglycan-binding domain
MTGEDVRILQASLNWHLGPLARRLNVDGSFGPATQERVVEFQRANHLNADGAVESQTMRALFDVRPAQVRAEIKQLQATPPAGRGAPTTPASFTTPPATPHFEVKAPSVLQNLPRPAPDPIHYWGWSLQAGQQVSVNPLYFSPWLINLSTFLIVKNDGRPDFALSFGAQYARNQLFWGKYAADPSQAPAGPWSAQLYGQFGLNSVGGPYGRFDPFNPFAQFFLAYNAGMPRQPVFGMAIGDQINWTVLTRYNPYTKQEDPVFSLSLNGQLVAGVDSKGQSTGPPSGQIFFGPTLSLPY